MNAMERNKLVKNVKKERAEGRRNNICFNQLKRFPRNVAKHFRGCFFITLSALKLKFAKTMIDLSCVSVYNYYSGSSALNGKENKSNNKY